MNNFKVGPNQSSIGEFSKFIGGKININKKMNEIFDKVGGKYSFNMVQKDFGDIKLLVTRATKDQLAETPLAEVIESKLVK